VFGSSAWLFLQGKDNDESRTSDGRKELSSTLLTQAFQTARRALPSSAFSPERDGSIVCVSIE
jgi:hypothetical protein